jgi:hypothetical protein
MVRRFDHCLVLVRLSVAAGPKNHNVDKMQELMVSMSKPGGAAPVMGYLIVHVSTRSEPWASALTLVQRLFFANGLHFGTSAVPGPPSDHAHQAGERLPAQRSHLSTH